MSSPGGQHFSWGIYPVCPLGEDPWKLGLVTSGLGPMCLFPLMSVLVSFAVMNDGTESCQSSQWTAGPQGGLEDLNTTCAWNCNVCYETSSRLPATQSWSHSPFPVYLLQSWGGRWTKRRGRLVAVAEGPPRRLCLWRSLQSE